MSHQCNDFCPFEILTLSSNVPLVQCFRCFISDPSISHPFHSLLLLSLRYKRVFSFFYAFFIDLFSLRVFLLSLFIAQDILYKIYPTKAKLVAILYSVISEQLDGRVFSNLNQIIERIYSKYY